MRLVDLLKIRLEEATSYNATKHPRPMMLLKGTAVKLEGIQRTESRA
jgi:hypothetical protein